MANWNETLGDGLRRDHRVACPNSTDRRSKRPCDCSYSCWIPDPSKRDGRRRQRIDGSLSITEAKREKQRLVLEARQNASHASSRSDGLHADADPYLRDWVRRLYEHQWATLRPSTRAVREVEYRLRIDPHLGHLPLSKITPEVVEDWIGTLIAAEGHTRPVEKAYECLRAALGVWCKRRTLVNPVTAIPHPRGRRHVRTSKEKALTTPQYRSLIDHYPEGSAERTLLRVAGEALLRASELCALQRGDIDLDNCVIHVRRALWPTGKGDESIGPPKNGSEATVPIHPTLRDELATLLAATYDENVTPESWVWPGRGARRERDPDAPPAPLATTSMSRRIRTLIEHAGMVDASGKALTTAHGLRATGLSIMAASGTPLWIVHAMARHSDVRVTEQHYLAAPDNAAMAGAVAVFDAGPTQTRLVHEGAG